MAATRRSAPAPQAPACTFVIFGASGDLTKRLLLPALLNLEDEDLLGAGFKVLGVSRTPMDDKGFRDYAESAMQQLAAEGSGNLKPERLKSPAWHRLRQRLHYIAGDFADDATFEQLRQHVGTDSGNAVFYLATAPSLFGPIVDKLGETGLVHESRHAWRRVIVEKPFGTDLASAKALNARLAKVLDESRIYRMDHFLGKETVQNIMVLRFGNGVFEPIWSRDHIEHVQITAAETVGVEARGAFYDVTGALRDMVPNHMFQLLAMIAMEAPNSFDANAIRTEKAKVVDAIRRLKPEEAVASSVRGQYGAGRIGDRKVAAYRKEPDVAPDSRTETYVALKLMIDNWRWSGVPFYIRTGKSMAERRTEIAIQFKRVPDVLFRDTPEGCPTADQMICRIQPNEGISLRFVAKRPGRAAMQLADVEMNFSYDDFFKREPSTGYETLIHDCLLGDPTLFQRADNIEAGWAAVQPFLDAWAHHKGRLATYAAGSSGPEQADELIGGESCGWRSLG